MLLIWRSRQSAPFLGGQKRLARRGRNRWINWTSDRVRFSQQHRMVSAEHRGYQEHRGAAGGGNHSWTKPGAFDDLGEWIADRKPCAPGTLTESLRHPRGPCNGQVT